MSTPAYISGDFWRICDRCGFKKRSSQTFRTWDGLFVCHEDWETRHPQDFVKGRVDNQNVPDSRPEAVDNIIGPLLTHISTAAVVGDVIINIDSSVRFMATDRISVLLDSGNAQSNIIFSVPSATSIRLTTPLSGKCAVGNVVIDYSAVSVANIG